MNIKSSILDTIGNTPLVYLNRLAAGLPGRIALKLEFFNPLGSVKDRIGISMIDTAEKAGILKPGMQIIEPTSGNTGIALAFICSAKGYPLTLVMPETMSMERRTLLIMLGAKVMLTPGAMGMKGAVAKAHQLIEQNKNAFMPRQFENAANPEIHRKTTAEEIWRDTDGTVDEIVFGVGTGGTLTGVASVLKPRKSSLKIIAVEPEESAVISGEKAGPHKIQGIGAGFIPANLETKYIDAIEKVSSADALAMAKRIIREEGVPVGISSGAALVAAIRRASLKENAGKLIVAIIPSTTERYLTTLLCEEERNQAASLPVEVVDPALLQMFETK